MDTFPDEDDSDSSWTEECFHDSDSHLEDDGSNSSYSSYSDDDIENQDDDSDDESEYESEDDTEEESDEDGNGDDDEIEGDEWLVDITKPYNPSPVNNAEEGDYDEVKPEDWGNLNFWIMLRDAQQIVDWFNKRKISPQAKKDIAKVFSPLNLAARVGSIPIFNFLLGEGFPLITADHLFLDASLQQKFDIMETLLNMGASVNATDSAGRTALHLLAKQLSYQPKKIKYLLSKGANIDQKDNSGMTALHNALVRGTKETVIALVKAGASVHGCSGRGRPILHMAVYRGLKITSLLYKAGARPGTSMEYSEVNAAVKIPNLNILRFLVKWNAPLEVDLLGVSKLVFSSKKVSANHMLDLLVGAGYRPSKDAVLKSEIENKPKNMYIVRKMRLLSSHPMSLNELACFKIRGILRTSSKSILDSVEILPVPEPLKENLLLKHVTQLHED